MLRALFYGILLGGALILSAWMGMADARTDAKRHTELRITAPVKIRSASGHPPSLALSPSSDAADKTSR